MSALKRGDRVKLYGISVDGYKDARGKIWSDGCRGVVEGFNRAGDPLVRFDLDKAHVSAVRADNLMVQT